MKALVTGGSGFIGRYLVNELKAQGNEVDVLTNQQVPNTIYGDVQDRDLMLKLIPNYDIVYHLAGVLGTSELITQAYEASKVNILGTVNILDGAVKHGTKVVEITKPNVWLNTYSITKYAAESFTKMYKEQLGLPTVSIKWFNVYGPGQSFHCQKAVPFFIRWALQNKDLEIWGDGEQTADFIHVHDAVRATIEVGKWDKLEGSTVDVGSGIETTVNELAELIIRKVGSKSQIKHFPMRPGETPNTRLMADLGVLNSIGFGFLHNLEDGMQETVDWYRRDLDL